MTTIRGYSALGLYAPKSADNFGGVLRAAHCYGATMVAIESPRQRAKEQIGKAQDTPKTHRHTPVFIGELKRLIPFDCIPVCVEISDRATNIATYTHPERAFYIFGPEEGSVPAEIQEWCRDVIYIPTRTCMNLAATANVVLFHRGLSRGELI